MKAFPHLKDKAYSDGQLLELGQLIDKFLEDHIKIWGALKYQKTTFRRQKDKYSKYNDINNKLIRREG